jgi:hypothetical protein
VCVCERERERERQRERDVYITFICTLIPFSLEEEVI